jgi:hypothetical protein
MRKVITIAEKYSLLLNQHPNWYLRPLELSDHNSTHEMFKFAFSDLDLVLGWNIYHG